MAKLPTARRPISSLKREVIAGLDILIVRELTSASISASRAASHCAGATSGWGINTQRYTES